MPNLGDYYRDLLIWEGAPFQELIARWPTDFVDEIKADFQSAVETSKLRGAVCNLRTGSSNQSIGNQVEEFTIQRLKSHNKNFIISPCSGAGYPDKLLLRMRCQSKIAMEFKATSGWNPADSNRRVLTCSSAKIRKCFLPPVYHLLCTVMYRIVGSAAEIETLRLDFLEPDTPVDVRLEASVSHRSLAMGPHSHIIL